MSLEITGRFLGNTGERRILRTAVALGTASIFGAVWVPPANAASAAVPVSSVVSTPAADVDPADSAAEIAAVEQLKENYFTDVDAKDWADLRTLFAPDAVVDTRSSFGPLFPSRDPFIVFTAVTLEALSTHHVGSDPQITVTSPTTAAGVWQLQDHLNVGNLIGVHGYASYSDTYEETGGKWVVATSTLNRTRLDLVILPGVADISFTIFDVNSANPVIRFISRALENIVDPTSLTSAASPTSAVATSAPAPTEDVPAAQAAPSVAKKVKTLVAPKRASIPAEDQAKPVTTPDKGVQAADSTTKSSSGPADPDGSSNTIKPKDAKHTAGLQAADPTAKSSSGPADPDGSSNTIKPKDANHIKGAAEPKKAAQEAKAE